jgi:4-amino-4-deoxy-L-arabinose transferase-like glycosyltransferase
VVAPYEEDVNERVGSLRRMARGHERAAFAVGLASIVACGIAVRFAYVELVAPHHRIFTDSSWYYVQARNIRTGLGYISVGREFAAANHHPDAFAIRATAYWPPAYPTFLAAWQAVFGAAVQTSQLAGCALGGATIVLVALLGRAVAGRSVALVAAALAAFSPFLIAVDGSLMSETLGVPLALLVLLLAQRARERWSVLTWCALGVALGALALVREDTLLLFALAVIPAAVLAHRPVREVVLRLALALMMCTLVIAPWIVRNANSVGVAELATLSTATGVAGANCRQTYEGPSLGSWSWPCTNPERGWHMSEARYARLLRDQAARYAFAHVERWPAVVAARVARVWGVWDPRDQIVREAAETRNRSWEWGVWVLSLPSLALALFGLRVLRRQGRPIAVLLAPVALATIVAVVGYGNSRFRAAAEAALLIPVAAALLALARWCLRGRRALPGDRTRAEATAT